MIGNSGYIDTKWEKNPYSIQITEYDFNPDNMTYEREKTGRTTLINLED